MALGKPSSEWIAGRQASSRRRILDAAWDEAHERGVAAVTLRAVADRVGMRPPSLYSHFDSKNALYDAMFAQAWAAYLEIVRAQRLPTSPRAALRAVARTFVDFALADLARYQLMNVQTVPGFVPSDHSYAVAVAALDENTSRIADLGVPVDPAGVDLFTALVSGLVSQQWANDPGGTRWSGLLDRAVDMFADHIGIPEEGT